MNVASRLKWAPPSLYDCCCRAVSQAYPSNRDEVSILPASVVFDVSFQLYKAGNMDQLHAMTFSLPVFYKLVRVGDKRVNLHSMFQALMDHKMFGLAESLAQSYLSLVKACRQVTRSSHHELQQWQKVYVRAPTSDELIELGLALGNFFREAAWYPAAQLVLHRTATLCEEFSDDKHLVLLVEIGAAYLSSLNSYCCYKESGEYLQKVLTLALRLQARQATCPHLARLNMAAVYVEAGAHCFAMNSYDKAYDYSKLACQELRRHTPPKVKLDVLRQCVRAAILRRQFNRGNFFIRRGVQFAKEKFGTQHPRYADVLMDYGFYLLNIDSTDASVQVYQKALDIRQAVFGGSNLRVACAHEDLAYATYVEQYSSGGFTASRDHAKVAISIFQKILPRDHLLLASAKRVLALILEEIAIDTTVQQQEKQLLDEAEELHLHSLELARSAYGELNIQTAKHYGNLGRLYQSMKRYKQAEEMHLRAIEIKEQMLGKEDYEVALSVGHLASLYNYDMGVYDKAETLYLRSIAIGKKLFGEGYSGLEYDYRGLLRLYSKTGNMNKAVEFNYIFHNWVTLRNQLLRVQKNPFNLGEGGEAEAEGEGDVEIDCVSRMLMV